MGGLPDSGLYKICGLRGDDRGLAGPPRACEDQSRILVDHDGQPLLRRQRHGLDCIEERLPVRQLPVDEGRDRRIAELLRIASELHDRRKARHIARAESCGIELLQNASVEVGSAAGNRFD